jgi:hypothetical protein
MFGLKLGLPSARVRRNSIKVALLKTPLQEYFDYPPAWKQLPITKSNKSQNQIKYLCKDLPFLRATVTSKLKIVKSVDFHIVPPWELEREIHAGLIKDFDPDYEDEIFGAYIKCEPNEFYYSLATEDDKEVSICLTPVEYFNHFKKRFSGELSLYISSLPQSTDVAGVTEVGNDTFVVIGKTLSQVNSEMIALGYIYNQEYMETVKLHR